MVIILRVVFILLISGAEDALAQPVNVVYRIDDRDTSEIFKSGFLSYGSNDSVDEHMSGDSIRDRSSGWISTTDNLDTASRIARNRFNLNPSSRNRVSWVYEIAQTDNMYDFNRIIQNEQSSWFISSARRAHLNALSLVYAPQREIGALGSIRAGQVVRARQIVWDPINGREQLVGEWVTNPNYDDATYHATRMNSGLYSFSHAVNHIYGVSSAVIFYAASWCIGHGSQPKAYQEQTICGDTEPLKYLDKEVSMSQQARTNYFPYGDL